MDNGSQTDLHIRRLPQGGYVVRDGRVLNPNHYCDDYFATADIDEALAFIRDKMVPIPPTQRPAGE